VYRQADAGDAAALAELRWTARALDEEPAVGQVEFRIAYKQFVDQGIAAGDRVHWIAECGGKIVACLVVQRADLVPRPCRPQDAMGLITDLYTLPEYRRRGIASGLLERAIFWARQTDLELIAVWSSYEARDWYMRRGFAPGDGVLQLELRPY
jgi:GNAT superfamily N-acetyltransferase